MNRNNVSPMNRNYASPHLSNDAQSSSHERSGSPSTSESASPYQSSLLSDPRDTFNRTSRIDGTDNKHKADNAEELKSIKKKPTVDSKLNAELTIRDIFPTKPASNTTTVLPNEIHASDAAQTTVIVVNPPPQAPVILSASEPVLVDRTSAFMLTVSATIGLSMPFIMLLGPKDLGSRAGWVGVAALSGVFLGGVYVMVSKVIQLRDQVHALGIAAGSPA